MSTTKRPPGPGKVIPDPLPPVGYGDELRRARGESMRVYRSNTIAALRSAIADARKRGAGETIQVHGWRAMIKAIEEGRQLDIVMD